VVSLEQWKNSPKAQRRFFFASLGVLAAGVVALIVFVVLPNKPTTDQPLSNQKAQLEVKDPKRPVDPQSIKVARQFLLTAVVRKNLNWAYDHVHPDLKGTMSRRVWDKGTIPVVPCDAQNAQTTAFIPQFSLQREVEFEVALIPKEHAVFCGEKPVRFWIALKREHDSANGQWLVSYWEPNWHPPVRPPAS
jgi:hypothetical protein